MRIQKCSICGEEDLEYRMWGYNTGRRTIWLCAKCHTLGERDVHFRELERKDRARKKAGEE